MIHRIRNKWNGGGKGKRSKKSATIPSTPSTTTTATQSPSPPSPADPPSATGSVSSSSVLSYTTTPSPVPTTTTMTNERRRMEDKDHHPQDKEEEEEKQKKKKRTSTGTARRGWLRRPTKIPTPKSSSQTTGRTSSFFRNNSDGNTKNHIGTNDKTKNNSSNKTRNEDVTNDKNRTTTTTNNNNTFSSVLNTSDSSSQKRLEVYTDNDDSMENHNNNRHINKTNDNDNMFLTISEGTARKTNQSYDSADNVGVYLEEDEEEVEVHNNDYSQPQSETKTTTTTTTATINDDRIDDDNYHKTDDVNHRPSSSSSRYRSFFNNHHVGDNDDDDKDETYSTRTPQSLEDLYLNPYDPALLVPSNRTRKNRTKVEDVVTPSTGGYNSGNNSNNNDEDEHYVDNDNESAGTATIRSVQSVSTNNSSSSSVMTSVHNNATSAVRNIQLLDFEKDLLTTTITPPSPRSSSSAAGDIDGSLHNNNTIKDDFCPHDTNHDNGTQSGKLPSSAKKNLYVTSNDDVNCMESTNHSPTSVLDLPSSIGGMISTMASTTASSSNSNNNNGGSDISTGYVHSRDNISNMTPTTCTTVTTESSLFSYDLPYPEQILTAATKTTTKSSPESELDYVGYEMRYVDARSSSSRGKKVDLIPLSSIASSTIETKPVVPNSELLIKSESEEDGRRDSMMMEKKDLTTTGRETTPTNLDKNTNREMPSTTTATKTPPRGLPVHVVHTQSQISTTSVGNNTSTPGEATNDKKTLSPAAASMARLQELEKRRHALRHQRFSLEQRLYEFRGRQEMQRKNEELVAQASAAAAATADQRTLSPSTETNNENGQYRDDSNLGVDSPLENTTPAKRALFRDPVKSESTLRQNQSQDHVESNTNSPSLTHIVEKPPQSSNLSHPSSTPKMVVDWTYTTAHGADVSFTGPLMVDKDGRPHPDKDHIVLQATLHFSDGQVYKGGVEHGLRHGQGQNRWPDGQEYIGEWANNSREGRGTHSWRDGRSVSGEWYGGHLNGKIYFTWPNGATFDGMAKMGKKAGRGVHTFADGKIYNGHYEEGRENGFGTLTLPDGGKYRGQFRNGFKEGYGVMLWTTRTYDGEWEQNKPHGQGRVVWSNGAVYTGQFLHGKYHGLGVYVWPSGKKFVGRWEDGVKNGHGLYTWPNGKKYDGEYVNGLKEGYGRMTWADGSMYCGGFKLNRRHGRGVQTNADGTVAHCGLWRDDRPIIDRPSNSAARKGEASSSTIDQEASVNVANSSLNTTVESVESSILPPPPDQSRVSTSDEDTQTTTYTTHSPLKSTNLLL